MAPAPRFDQTTVNVKTEDFIAKKIKPFCRGFKSCQIQISSCFAPHDIVKYDHMIWSFSTCSMKLLFSIYGIYGQSKVILRLCALLSMSTKTQVHKLGASLAHSPAAILPHPAKYYSPTRKYICVRIVCGRAPWWIEGLNVFKTPCARVDLYHFTVKSLIFIWAALWVGVPWEHR